MVFCLVLDFSSKDQETPRNQETLFIFPGYRIEIMYCNSFVRCEVGDLVEVNGLLVNNALCLPSHMEMVGENI